MPTPLRVLVLEDVPADAELVVHELQQAGFQPDWHRVETGEDYLSHLHPAPDIILADYTLPRFDALRALHLLQERGLDIPFIVVTGTIGEEAAVDCVKRGATDYVIKDRLARLGPAVTQALEAKRLRDEKRLAEAALRESEERYATILQSAAEGILVADLETKRFAYANPAICQMLGYSQEEMMRLGVQDVHPAESLEHVIGEFEAQARGEKLTSTDLPCRRKDGSVIFADITAGRMTINKRRCNAGFFTDVSERKRAEAERSRLEAQLRGAQRMEAIGNLAGGIAHDFNNLLTAILGYAELLLEQLDSSSPLRRDVEQIKNAGESAASLINRLLAFSRRQVLQPAVLDLNAVVKNIDGMLRRVIAEDIELTTVLDPMLWRVNADRAQLDQVIMNLVVNARDAMPRGGRLTIETTNAELDDAYADAHPPMVPGRYVMLAVTDTGCGMDAETKARMFEPFFTTKPRGEGTGLGLPTVYGIVKQSGGHIWAYSEPNQGTTVKIYLPWSEMPVETVESDVFAPGPGRGSETILLVEDQEIVRSLAAEALRRQGYTVLEACNGGQAVLLAEQHEGPIDLLLTDVVLPGMNGANLVECLVPLRPLMKVLYVSGYPDKAIVQHGVLKSGTSFLGKPFTPAKLIRTVRGVLDRRIEKAGAS